MGLYTSSYLKDKYRNVTGLEQTRLFSKSINEAKTASPLFDIFLCHSFLDKEVVGGFYIELTQLGYTVYVDWIVDPDLDRANVTKESANRVRNRLKGSKSLLLATSENAAVSKWMPWELGFADGRTGNCAIVPVSPTATSSNSYKGAEYLSLYPYITKVSEISELRGKLLVVENAVTYADLNEMVHHARKPSFKYQRLF
jgi:hypothetical protein